MADAADESLWPTYVPHGYLVLGLSVAVCLTAVFHQFMRRRLAAAPEGEAKEKERGQMKRRLQQRDRKKRKAQLSDNEGRALFSDSLEEGVEEPESRVSVDRRPSDVMEQEADREPTSPASGVTPTATMNRETTIDTTAGSSERMQLDESYVAWQSDADAASVFRQQSQTSEFFRAPRELTSGSWYSFVCKSRKRVTPGDSREEAKSGSPVLLAHSSNASATEKHA